ncbi:unnamed protein product [Notodromas monacha]|uniref:Uncharacterized protein n=1 Tax=Notodromas monacha TaxID=399045 RepID=A0A7R9C382_9CRUS|nr:unnamed protein product [Notodromas monacha]CAG0925478.1 unnamed protein product [Notodromas monacha]
MASESLSCGDDDDDEEEPCSDGPVRNVAERDAQQFKESQDDPDVLDRDHRPLNLQHRVMKEDLRIPLNKLQGLMSFFYTFFKMNPPPESPPNSRRRRRHKPSRHEVLDEDEESFVLGNRNPPKSLRIQLNEGIRRFRHEERAKRDSQRVKDKEIKEKEYYHLGEEKAVHAHGINAEFESVINKWYDRAGYRNFDAPSVR